MHNLNLVSDNSRSRNFREGFAGHFNSPDRVLVICVDEKKTTLFASLDLGKGGIPGGEPRQRYKEFLGLLRHLETCVLPEFDVHLIVENYEGHKHPEVQAWLAQHTRYHVHSNSSYSSWLDQAEHWFGVVAQNTIGPKPFITMRTQAIKIDALVQRYGRTSRPLILPAAAADFFLQKIVRVCSRISGTLP